MNTLKIIICSTVGMLIALQIMRVVPNLNTQQIFTDKIQTTPEQTFATAALTRNTLDPQKINFTIKNGTTHKLTCVKQIEGKTSTFLVLTQHETRNYENINENEYIGCNLGLEGLGTQGASTVLTWFHVTSGTYMMLLNKVPCNMCKGETERWGTVVMTEKGEILPQTF